MTSTKTAIDTLPSAPLVGLSGWAQSGKDTAATALVDDGWQRLAFADTLRDFLFALNPLVPANVTDIEGVCVQHHRLADIVRMLGWDTAKTTYPEVRALLQRCGTDAGRAVLGTNVWVDATLAKVNPLRPTVVTDVRFPNEADAIRALGGVVVRIDRPGHAPVNDHPSERALDDYAFDWRLSNHGSVCDLHTAVRAFVSEHLNAN